MFAYGGWAFVFFRFSYLRLLCEGGCFCWLHVGFGLLMGYYNISVVVGQDCVSGRARRDLPGGV